MANYSNLKAAIAAAIKTNGNQEITGQVLQDVLTSMVSVIGANYTFAGVATPSTNPGAPDQNVVYLASEGGTYTNFNGTVLPAGISLLMWNGTWTSKTVMYGDGGVFDISVYKSTGGTLATFADLAAALDGGNNIPASARKGGMSVKFVQSSDDNYVQYMYLGTAVTGTPNPFLDLNNWQKTNLEGEVNQSLGKNKVYYKELSATTLILEHLSFIKDCTYKYKVTFTSSYNLWIQIRKGDTLLKEQNLVSGETYSFVPTENYEDCTATLVPIGGGSKNIDVELQSDTNQPFITGVKDFREYVKNVNIFISEQNNIRNAIKEIYLWGAGVVSNATYTITNIHRNIDGYWRIYVQKDGTNIAVYESTSEDKGVICFGDLRKVFVAIIIDWDLFTTGTYTRVNYNLTDKAFNLDYSPSIKEYIESKEQPCKIMDDGVVELSLSEFQGSGYWNDDKGINSHVSWTCGKVDISQYVGKNVRFKLGYDAHNAAHCYIDVNGIYTAVTELQSYYQFTEYSSFVVPEGSTTMYYAYGALTPYIYAYTGEILISYNVTNDYHKVPLDGIFSQVGDTRYFEFANNTNKRQTISFLKKPDGSEVRYVKMFLMPFEKRTLEITHGSESTLYYVLRPSDISDGIDITVNIFKNKRTTLEDKNECIPFIGYGKKIISQPFEIMAHGPRVINTEDRLFVVYMGSGTQRSEGHNISHIVLYTCDKVSNRKSYKYIENPILVDEFISQQKVSDTFNYSVAMLDGIMYIRYSCVIGDADSAMVYKTFNPNSMALSDIAMQKLYYNNTEVDWTWNNYIKMVNSLYGYSFDETLRKRWTLEANGITEYDGKYYCITAHQCSENAVNINVPYILMRSTDLIKWEPVTVLFDTKPSGETELAIVNDKILCLFRSQSLGTFYCVYGIDGTQIKEVTKISKVDSKPFVFVYNDELYCMYNIATQGVDVDNQQQWDAFYSLYYGRVKVAIAKLDSNNDLNTIQSYYSPDGWCYFTASVLGNQIYVVNAEDTSGYHKGNGGPIGDITIQQLIIES